MVHVNIRALQIISSVNVHDNDRYQYKQIKSKKILKSSHSTTENHCLCSQVNSFVTTTNEISAYEVSIILFYLLFIRKQF